MEYSSISIIDGKVIIIPVNGTVWMSKHQIADLFGCFVAKVVSNIAAILKSGALDESRVCRLCRYKDCSSVELYNLEMITALAFRIRSRNADLFRRWLMERAVQRPDKKIATFISLNDTVVPN